MLRLNLETLLYLRSALIMAVKAVECALFELGWQPRPKDIPLDNGVTIQDRER